MDSAKKVILLISCISVFFEALDIAIINLTLPLIQEGLNIEGTSIQWLQTIYVLFYGGFLALGGKMADRLGRKKIFLAGSSLFLITSLGAGLSSSFQMLLVFRGVQGIAAGLLMPSALSIVTTSFPEPTERSKAIAMFSAFAAVGSGSGLAIGGLLASVFGWPSVFFINVPVILVTLLLSYVYVPRDTLSDRTPPDFISGCLLTTGLISLSYIVHEFPHGDLALLLLLGIFIVVIGVLFLKRNQSSSDPLIPFGLVKNATTPIGIFFLLGGLFTGFLFLISLVLQKNLQYSPAQAGLLIFPFSVLSAITGKYLIPAVLQRMNIPQLAIIGMASMCLGAASLAWFLHTGGFAVLLFSMACINGIGIAVSFTALTVLSVQSAPEASHGIINSIATTSFFFGGGLGLSLVSLFLNTTNQYMVGMKAVLVLGLFPLTGLVWLWIYFYRGE
jgi:MFS family permease